MPVFCTGSIAYDYLMTFPGYFKDHILAEHLDKLSLSFLVDSMVRQRGGVAPNIAYTLALLGESNYLVGTVGEDFEDYRAWMEKSGVNTQFARVIQGLFTASFFANTDRSNAQISSFYPGAMAEAGRIHMHELLPLNPELVVISPNDPGAMHQYVMECVELGLPYLYDPSQQIVRMPAEQLRYGAEHAHCLFVNEYEYQLLQKHTGLNEKALLQHMRFMVVTLGKDGAEIFADGQRYHTPVVPPVEIADPTGVGDAFRGGFLRGLRLNLGWEVCGRMGALAATYCLEQRGTQAHHYTVTEYVARYRQHFDDQGALDKLTKAGL